MTSKNRKTPIPEWRAVSSLWARNRGFFGVFGAPGGIRTHGLPLRRTRVVLLVRLVLFDFLAFHLDLSRNSASFPKR